jgi:cytochrome c oxidase assembly protein subunit 16
MPEFQSKKFRPSSYQNNIGAIYRKNLGRHPFLLFGLPFILTIVSGSFVLTPATALRYERHDRKVKQMSTEEELGIGKDRRRVDINEEYYRLAAKVGGADILTFWVSEAYCVLGLGQLGQQEGEEIAW